MNYRINTKVIAIFVILFFVVVGFLLYSLFLNTFTQHEVKQEQATTTVQEEVKNNRIVSAKHQYLDGIHTLAGKIEVPTSCHRLLTEPVFTTTDHKIVEVRFNTILEGEECSGDVFVAPFSVSFEAPEDVEITATWNGAPLRLNLIPLKKGEIIDSELFIKG